MWYGQENTDKVIAQYFDPDYIGTCVEVGVSDGVRGSNTKYFEDKGWRALCIDPIPDHVTEARKTRKLVVECACGSKTDIKDFFVFDIGDRNIKSSLSGLKTDNRLLVSHGHLINKCYTIEVQVLPLQKILDEVKFRSIDFVSIDTEGTELDVLKGMDLLLNPPKLLVVENNFEDKEISDYLRVFNYKKIERYHVNDFYIKD